MFASRYGWTVENIEALDIITMHRLVDKIRKENRETKLYNQWLTCYPFMAAGFIKDMSFEDYKRRAVITIDTRPAAEILAEVEAVKKELEG